MLDRSLGVVVVAAVGVAAAAAAAVAAAVGVATAAAAAAAVDDDDYRRKLGSAPKSNVATISSVLSFFGAVAEASPVPHPRLRWKSP